MKNMSHSRSIQQSRRNQSATPTKGQAVAQGARGGAQNDHYFCHFRNAMYMGGIKAFQKHGRGVLLHDDGTSVITSYFNDFRNGHNIYYKQNCIISVHYQKNKIQELVFRASLYLLLLRYSKDHKIEGKALLIDYNIRAIYYLVYKRGAIVEKREQKDPSVLNRIFDLQNLEYLIGKDHANAIKFEVERDQNIASQKSSSKFQAGFFKKGYLNGLGFILLIKNPSQSVQDYQQSQEAFVQVVERGYFINSQLNGMGEKRFKNGNYYVGDFKAGVFEGRGLLKNEVKKNWVFGLFEAGNMCDMLNYSHESDATGLENLVKSLHERKNNWINNQIQIPDHKEYLDEIQKILVSNPTQEMNNLKQKKQEVLKKIQDAFVYGDNDQEMENSNFNQENDPRNSNINHSSRKFGEKSLRQSSSMVMLNEKAPDSQKYATVERQQGEVNNSRFKFQPFEPNTTKGSSGRLRATSSRQLGIIPQERARTPSARQMRRSRAGKEGSNQDQLSFALDSKRLIGRSRIFKQFSSEEPDLPKFNYIPK